MAHASDAILAIGSTLSIYPAASVVAKTARRGKPLVIVNQVPTDHDDLAAVKVDGQAGTVGWDLSAGDVEDGVDVLAVDRGDQAACLGVGHGDQLYPSSMGLRPHLGHDRQLSAGSCPHHQPGARPGDVLIG